MSGPSSESLTVEKLEVGIPGFDFISEGGLPQCRSTLVAGTAGSGKTVFALQFLMAGIRDYGQNGVLVTFEESGDDLVRNVRGFGWELQDLVDQGRMAIVDASLRPGERHIEIGHFDLSGLLARIESQVRRIDAKRVVLDSAAAIFPQFTDAHVVRRELRAVAAGLRQLGVTTVVTAERSEEYGAVSRFGVEEFVADNVVILRNPLDQEKRRRTIEILKYRGVSHQKGEYPFTIDPTGGVTVMPLSAMELVQRSSDVRVSSGSPDLDAMCGGGLFRDSIILVSGATGTGKTLMVTEFTKAAIKSDERALLFAFEESRDQLFRNARSWGVDLENAEGEGRIKVVARYPESASLEDHLLKMRRDIEAFEPDRIAVDSLSALERVSTLKSFREFVIGVTSHIKALEIPGMFTNTSSMLMGGESITETHISTITDAIILLRYVELFGEMSRGITVLKMRGSWHQKGVREYHIDDSGMHIGDSFRDVTGIIGGAPVHRLEHERERLREMFEGG